MRRFWGVFFTRLLVVFCLPSLLGCFLFPVKTLYISSLTAEQGQKESYTIGPDGTISYEIEGLRVSVKHMTDQELNNMFPEESSQGEYSINPYTYGNYIDPAVGYVRNRFTVFRVAVQNRTFAKVELDPLKAVVKTDRGEVFHAYGISTGSAEQNFESYYRALRRPSGNEYYRFDMRMGIVRSNNYRVDEKIFKGEHYEGFIVFDPLDEAVKKAHLILKDFVLKFDAYDRPIQTTDLSFDFNRTITRQVLATTDERSTSDGLKGMTWVMLGPTQIMGNVADDVTRDESAINAVAKTNLDPLNRCFEEAFLKGDATEGEVTVTVTVHPNGVVTQAGIVTSTVGSGAVEECLVTRIKKWRFKPSSGPSSETTSRPEEVTERAGAEKGPASYGQEPALSQQVQAVPLSDVTVIYSFNFGAAAQSPEVYGR
jgi:TonB family protein